MKIKTEHVFPPIPIRTSDWCAYDDDTYEPGCPIGWGPTQEAAIADLREQLDLDEPSGSEHDEELRAEGRQPADEAYRQDWERNQ